MAFDFAVAKRADRPHCVPGSGRTLALVVNQMNGGFRVTKQHLADLLAEVLDVTDGALDFQIEWFSPRGNP